MQEKQILQHTKQAVDALAPDDCFDAIWDKASTANREDVPFPEDIKKSRRTTPRLLAGLAVAAACICFLIGFGWYQQTAVYATINLDINPSICICVNRSNHVLSISGLNEDGEKLIANLTDVHRQPVSDVLENTVATLVDNGFLTDAEENAILISVDGRNAEQADTLVDELSSQIFQEMDKRSLPGSIIGQRMEPDNADIQKLSEQMHISEGKATLIYNMKQADEQLSEKDLAAMKMDQLVEKVQDENLNMEEFSHPAIIKRVEPDMPTETPASKDSSSPQKNTKKNAKKNSETQTNEKTTSKDSSSDSKKSTKKKQQEKDTEHSSQKETEKPDSSSKDDSKKKDSKKSDKKHKQTPEPEATATPAPTQEPEEDPYDDPEEHPGERPGDPHRHPPYDDPHDDPWWWYYSH